LRLIKIIQNTTSSIPDPVGGPPGHPAAREEL
jgi:hypothetical protein